MITIQLDDKELDKELLFFMKSKGITTERDAWVATNIRDGLKIYLQVSFCELLKSKYGKNDINIGVSAPRVRVRLSRINGIKETKDKKYWLEIKVNRNESL